MTVDEIIAFVASGRPPTNVWPSRRAVSETSAPPRESEAEPGRFAAVRSLFADVGLLLDPRFCWACDKQSRTELDLAPRCSTSCSVITRVEPMTVQRKARVASARGWAVPLLIQRRFAQQNQHHSFSLRHGSGACEGARGRLGPDSRGMKRAAASIGCGHPVMNTSQRGDPRCDRYALWIRRTSTASRNAEERRARGFDECPRCGKLSSAHLDLDRGLTRPFARSMADGSRG